MCGAGDGDHCLGKKCDSGRRVCKVFTLHRTGPESSCKLGVVQGDMGL